MNWIDVFFGKDLVKKISKSVKGIAVLVFTAFVLHMSDIYSSHKDWIWKTSIKLPSSDADTLIHQKYQLPNTVDIHTSASDIIFHFATFSEWLNRYTIGFVIFDSLKWLVWLFILWQLSNIVSEKTDFTGFTTDGVKYLRRAALPIMFIPYLDLIKYKIVINYAITQSTNLPFKVLLLTPNNDLLYDLFYYPTITSVLLGLAEIFRYGMQLKEETDLTV